MSAKEEITNLLKGISPGDRRRMVEDILREIEDIYPPYTISIDVPIEETLQFLKEKLAHQEIESILHGLRTNLLEIPEFKSRYAVVMQIEEYSKDLKIEFSDISVLEFITFNSISSRTPDECTVFIKIQNRRKEKKYLICKHVWYDFHNPEILFNISSEIPKGEKVYYLKKIKKEPA